MAADRRRRPAHLPKPTAASYREADARAAEIREAARAKLAASPIAQAARNVGGITVATSGGAYSADAIVSVDCRVSPRTAIADLADALRCQAARLDEIASTMDDEPNDHPSWKRDSMSHRLPARYRAA